MAGRFANLEFATPRQASDALQVEAPPDGRHYLAKAREEALWGQFEPALRLHTRALQEDRALVPAWVGQVQMLVQLGELHEARVWADKALELFRDNGELMAAKAQACARLADRRAALACSDGSLRAPGSSPWRWIARGEVQLAGGQKQADDCFQKALLEPAADWADRLVIAGIYLFYKRATNAMLYIKKALELEASHGYAWLLLGDAQMLLGMAGAARESYARCLELRPDFVPARAALDRAAGGAGILSLAGGFLRRWSGR